MEKMPDVNSPWYPLDQHAWALGATPARATWSQHPLTCCRKMAASEKALIASSAAMWSSSSFKSCSCHLQRHSAHMPRGQACLKHLIMCHDMPGATVIQTRCHTCSQGATQSWCQKSFGRGTLSMPLMPYLGRSTPM